MQNKYASATLNTASARLAHAVNEAEPPAFGLFPPADAFEHDAPQHVADLCAAFSEYIYALVSELSAQGVKIDPRDFIAPLADMESEIVGACNEHAYDMRESVLEDAHG